MNLLLICESFPTSPVADFTGGVEARDFYIARELSKAHQVTVITNARRGSPSHQNLSGIHVIRCGLTVTHQHRNNPLSRLVFIISSIITSLSQAPDIVQGSNIFAQFPAFIIGSIHHCPKVALVHDVFINHWFQNTDPLTAVIGEIMERLVLRLPWDLIITNSGYTHTKLGRAGINSHRQQTIPGGVDLAACRAIKTAKDPHPTIIFAGRLVGYKQVADIINALVAVKTKLPDIRLKIIGIGPQQHRLKSQVHSLHLGPSVKFLGFITSHHQVLTHIKAAHIFCLPSTVEGFGLVTLEAAACGTPYVNSDIAATREVTHTGQGGLLFKARDTSHLARQLTTLLTNTQLYRQKVAAGRQLAREYDWSIIAGETTAAYQSILTRGS